MRSSLRAILLLVATAGGSACGDADAAAGAWEFKADTTRQTSWLRVVGREGGEGAARTRAVILSFDCLPDDASIRIMTEQSLRQGSVEARLTVDGDRPITLPGFAGTTPTGGQVVFTLPQDSLLTLLSGRRRAVLEYTDGAGSSRTTAEFPLPGLEAHRAAFRAACGRQPTR